MPCLMLMDLKLPKMSGFDVLKWLRTQPELQTLRVIVLSSSRMPPDIGAEMVKTARKALTRALGGAVNTATRSAGKVLASRLRSLRS